MNKIVTNKRQVRELANVFNVTGLTIRNALSFKTQSILAHKIRSYALNNLGAFLIKL